MAGEEPPKPDPEHLARFRKVMTALVAVPKNEVLDAFVKKHGNKPMRLGAGGKVIDVPDAKHPPRGKRRPE